MTESETGPQRSRRNEIVIAIIGLVGALVTGFLSNWDKVFPKQNTFQATYSGYRPTGDFETELRYYFEVSGTRAALESTQRQLVQNAKISLLSEYPKDAEQINKIFASWRGLLDRSGDEDIDVLARSSSATNAGSRSSVGWRIAK